MEFIYAYADARKDTSQSIRHVHAALKVRIDVRGGLSCYPSRLRAFTNTPCLGESTK